MTLEEACHEPLLQVYMTPWRVCFPHKYARYTYIHFSKAIIWKEQRQRRHHEFPHDVVVMIRAVPAFIGSTTSFWPNGGRKEESLTRCIRRAWCGVGSAVILRFESACAELEEPVAHAIDTRSQWQAHSPYRSVHNYVRLFPAKRCHRRNSITLAKT